MSDLQFPAMPDHVMETLGVLLTRELLPPEACIEVHKTGDDYTVLWRPYTQTVAMFRRDAAEGVLQGAEELEKELIGEPTPGEVRMVFVELPLVFIGSVSAVVRPGSEKGQA